MKKIVFSLVVIACLLTLGVGNAFANEITETSLADYIAAKEPTAQLVDVDTAMKRIETPTFAASCVIHGLDEDLYEDEKPKDVPVWSIGWYRTTTLAPAFNYPVEVNNDLFKSFTSIGPFTPEDYSFGLYLKDDGENYYYTQQSLNPTGVNVVAYQVQQANEHRWIIGFDFNPNDENENVDIVIWLQPVVSADIPEFPTIAMPIAAVLGLMFVFGRKKEE